MNKLQIILIVFFFISSCSTMGTKKVEEVLIQNQIDGGSIYVSRLEHKSKNGEMQCNKYVMIENNDTTQIIYGLTFHGLLSYLLDVKKSRIILSKTEREDPYFYHIEYTHSNGIDNGVILDKILETYNLTLAASMRPYEVNTLAINDSSLFFANISTKEPFGISQSGAIIHVEGMNIQSFSGFLNHSMENYEIETNITDSTLMTFNFKLSSDIIKTNSRLKEIGLCLSKEIKHLPVYTVLRQNY